MTHASAKIRFAVMLSFFSLIGSTISCKNEPVVDKSTHGGIVDSIPGRSFEQGKLIFERLCTPCHVPPERGGQCPDLFYRLFERLPAPPEEYFLKFIKDSKSLKTSGNKYALKVDKVWNTDYEHNFKDSLSWQNSNALISYIKISGKLRR